MRLIKEVHKPCNCLEKIEKLQDQRTRNAALELWVGSIIECDCGKWWRLEDGREGVFWYPHTPTTAELMEDSAHVSLASPGRTML